jgi:hypothetical protein
VLSLSKKIDEHLIDLSWSLWTELGVAGVKRRHQHCLIALEELIILTAIIAEADPRLRDEALDWCTRYHHFVSISRLRNLVKDFGSSVWEPFSLFAATLNSVSRSNWPLFSKVKPLKFKPSGKSKPPQCELPALLCLRFRALFGVGARADLITYFLTQKKSDVNASDAAEMGYSKRSLADLLEDFVRSGFFDVFTTRNQRNYRLKKCDQVKKIAGMFPEITPPWRQILDVLLPLRMCIQEVEKKSAAIKMVEIRTALLKVENKLARLNLSPPSMQSDFSIYWDTFTDWMLHIVKELEKTGKETF